MATFIEGQSGFSNGGEFVFGLGGGGGGGGGSQGSQGAQGVWLM